jgi:chromosome segregation ATPase
MAFTVEDLRDLAELLRAHPEWREPLWALLASEEVRRMPERMERSFQRAARLILALYRAQRQHYKEFVAHRAETDRRFAELAEAQRRTEESLRRLAEEFAAHRQEFAAHRQEFIAHRQEFLEFRAEVDRRFAELAEAQRRHYEEFAAYRAETDRRFAELAEAQRRHYEEFAAHRAETDRRFAELAEALRILTERVDRVEARLDRVETRLDRVEVRLDRVEARLEDHSRDLGELKSMRLEALYAEKPAVLFRSLLRRAAIVPDARQAEILEEAVAAGRITMEEADRAAPLDALVEGFHRREDRRVYLAVEISWQGTTKDVARAAERAAVFARALGAEVIPVVAAKELTAPARRMARARGVWWLQDGRAFAPQEIPEEGPGEEPERGE